MINKILLEMEKESRWSEQLRFLILCRQKGIIPKGMRTKISGNLVTSEYGRRLKRNHEMKILRKNISELQGKKVGSDQRISQLKLNLRETFGMSGNFVENTVKWLQKKKYSFYWKRRKSLTNFGEKRRNK